VLVDARSFAGGRALARKVGAGIEYYLNGAKYGERENVEVVLHYIEERREKNEELKGPRTRGSAR